MKGRIFSVIINFFLFWVVSDIFSGIEIREGVAGYLICGGIFGFVMVAVVPLIKFFTLPVKFISLFFVALMLSVIVFFFLNFAIPLIDFRSGTILGFSNRYFQLPEVNLSMMGNVLVGGVTCGLLSAILAYLKKASKSGS